MSHSQMSRGISVFASAVLLSTLLLLSSPGKVARAAVFTAGDFTSLSTAITTANSDGVADTIYITANITLTGALPQITTQITIEGNGFAIDGADTYRVFNSSGVLTINYLTIQNGLAISNGGAGIYNTGNLTINDCTFIGNAATTSNAFGGALHNNAGGAVVAIVNSTFTGNSASIGGAIRNVGSLSITNSTISGNSAVGFGGGVTNTGPNASLTLNNVTISGNTAGTGGGLRNDTIMNFTATIIANSISGGDCSNMGTININVSNLVEDGTCSPAVSGDPSLDPLANNGGLTQTHALQSGSFAIDQVANAFSTVDQRGAARDYDGDGLGGAGTEGDIGAYEYRAPTENCSQSSSITLEGITLDFTNWTTGCVTVDEMGPGVDHPAATGTDGTHLRTDDWWHISSTAVFDSVTISLPYSTPDNNTRVCKWPGLMGGAGWDCGTDTDNDPGIGVVTRTGITSFSDWAVGQNVGPTAIQLLNLGAQTNTHALVTMLALVVFGFIGAVAFWNNRRSH